VTTPVLTPRAAREQRTFRALLDSMARPGNVCRLWQAGETEQRNPLLAVAEALVDHEVTFALLAPGGLPAEQILRSTGSRVAAVAEADYVFCDVPSLVEALRSGKEGTPEYPDQGATVVCGLAGLGRGEKLTLSGPGIRDEARIQVEGLTAEARRVFAERNAMPPLGLDLILVSQDGRVVSLGRYTRIQEE
jgi:alpha-D-ribose 1-methylphosphonate 5-triphosphate synthase subunit PhnH